MKPAFLKGILLDASGLKEALLGDLGRVEELLARNLASESAFISDLNAKVLAQSGKRLRPALHILAAGHPGDSPRAVLLTAAVIEMLHTASLLHDDVVDESRRRRGRPTLNASDGNGAAILMGDFVYTRAIYLMLSEELVAVTRILAETVHHMSIGELLQLELKRKGLLDEESYLAVIYDKTARLIETACVCGSLLSGGDESDRAACSEFGRNIGLAFQIVDDVFDYVADPNRLGKPVGLDVAENTQTLPLLLAHRNADDSEKRRLEDLLLRPAERREEIVDMVKRQGGVEAAMAEAKRYASQAHRALENLSGRRDAGIIRALQATVDYVVEREL